MNRLISWFEKMNCMCTIQLSSRPNNHIFELLLLSGSKLGGLYTVQISYRPTLRIISRGPKCDRPMKACRPGPTRLEEHSSPRKASPDQVYVSSPTKTLVSTSGEHLWRAYQWEPNPLIASSHLWTKQYKRHLAPEISRFTFHISTGVVLDLSARARDWFLA